MEKPARLRAMPWSTGCTRTSKGEEKADNGSKAKMLLPGRLECCSRDKPLPTHAVASCSVLGSTCWDSSASPGLCIQIHHFCCSVAAACALCRYRTTLCGRGESCTRNICFFAHTQQELRIVGIQGTAAASSTADADEAATLLSQLSLTGSSSQQLSARQQGYLQQQQQAPGAEALLQLMEASSSGAVGLDGPGATAGLLQPQMLLWPQGHGMQRQQLEPETAFTAAVVVAAAAAAAAGGSMSAQGQLQLQQQQPTPPGVVPAVPAVVGPVPSDFHAGNAAAGAVAVAGMYHQGMAASQQHQMGGPAAAAQVQPQQVPLGQGLQAMPQQLHPLMFPAAPPALPAGAALWHMQHPAAAVGVGPQWRMVPRTPGAPPAVRPAGTVSVGQQSHQHYILPAAAAGAAGLQVPGMAVMPQQGWPTAVLPPGAYAQVAQPLMPAHGGAWQQPYWQPVSGQHVQQLQHLPVLQQQQQGQVLEVLPMDPNHGRGQGPPGDATGGHSGGGVHR